MNVPNHEYIKIFASFLCANNFKSKGKDKFIFCYIIPVFKILDYWKKKYYDDYHTRNIQLYAMFISAMISLDCHAIGLSSVMQ